MRAHLKRNALTRRSGESGQALDRSTRHERLEEWILRTFEMNQYHRANIFEYSKINIITPYLVTSVQLPHSLLDQGNPKLLSLRLLKNISTDKSVQLVCLFYLILEIKEGAGCSKIHPKCMSVLQYCPSFKAQAISFDFQLCSKSEKIDNFNVVPSGGMM